MTAKRRRVIDEDAHPQSAYSIGFMDGEENAFNEILEIVESLNHNGSVSTRLLRKALHSLKGERE